MARYVLHKQKDSAVVFTSMQDIAKVFVKELREVVKVGRQNVFDQV